MTLSDIMRMRTPKCQYISCSGCQLDPRAPTTMTQCVMNHAVIRSSSPRRVVVLHLDNQCSVQDIVQGCSFGVGPGMKTDFVCNSAGFTTLKLCKFWSNRVVWAICVDWFCGGGDWPGRPGYTSTARAHNGVIRPSFAFRKHF